MKWRLERLGVPVGEILQDDLQRAQDAHRALARRVEVLANGVLEERHVDHAVSLGDADALAEGADRRGSHAASSEAGERRHSRIVPSRHVLADDELLELSFALHRVSDVELRELDLLWPRLRQRDLIEEPIVERPMVLELERADRVRHAFHCVAEAVREIVHRVDRPRVAGAMMMLALDAVHHRIAQVLVGARHVDLRAENVRAVGELTRAHARK